MKSTDERHLPTRVRSDSSYDEEANAATESMHFLAHADLPVTEQEDNVQTTIREKDAERRPQTRRGSFPWLCHLPGLSGRIGLAAGLLAVLVVSSLASFVLGASAGRRTIDLDRQCAAHTAKYSPVLKVGIHYGSVLFNGSFMDEDVYRRQGSPEVDSAWEALGVDYRAGVISDGEGLRSGLTMSHVQRSDRYGSGFMVNVEGMHHLHCLNLVRKSLYYNYPYYKALGLHAFKNNDEILQLHVSHCLDVLRQVLMCNVDTGILGQVWYKPESPAAFPDFHTTHTCKNYDAVRQWAEDLQAPPPESLPPDYLQLPNPADIWPTTP